MLNKLKDLISLIASIILTVIILKLFPTDKNNIIIIPFIICILCTSFIYIFSLLGNELGKKYSSKIYIITFLLYWFGGIVYETYIFIKTQEYSMILITIPFWLVGFLIIKFILFKKKEVKEI